MTICPLDAEYKLAPQEIVPDLPFFNRAIDETQPLVQPDFVRDMFTRVNRRDIARTVNYTRQIMREEFTRRIPVLPTPQGGIVRYRPNAVKGQVVRGEETLQIPQVVIERDQEDELDRLVAIWNEEQSRPNKKHFKRVRAFGRFIRLGYEVAFKGNRD